MLQEYLPPEKIMPRKRHQHGPGENPFGGGTWNGLPSGGSSQLITWFCPIRCRLCQLRYARKAEITKSSRNRGAKSEEVVVWLMPRPSVVSFSATGGVLMMVIPPNQQPADNRKSSNASYAGKLLTLKNQAPQAGSTRLDKKPLHTCRSGNRRKTNCRSLLESG